MMFSTVCSEALDYLKLKLTKFATSLQLVEKD